ncbi:MAG TPA: PqqD family protein [Mycobacteriales bacterium]|nr:PqqD family protein [Mycobacteriales bacterium]
MTVEDILFSVSPSEAPAPGTAVVAVELDGETVLYDEDAGALHLLDPIATVVWQCLDGEATLEQISVELAAAFEAPPEAVTGDVIELVTRLGRLGLLEGVETTEDLTDFVVNAPTAAGADDC